MRLPFTLPARLGLATQSFLSRIPFRLPYALGLGSPDAGSALMLRAYRVRYDDGTESTAHWRAAPDTAWTQYPGQPFRIRFLLQRIPTSNQLSSFVDNFSTALDPLRWEVVGGATTSGGQLLLPCTAGYSAVNSRLGFNLLGSHVSVRVVATPTDTNGTTETMMMFYADADNLLHIDKMGSTDLLCQARVNGVETSTMVAWDPVAMAWWRIRESAGSVYYETAPDGVAWTIQASVATPAFAAAGDVRLLSGYGGVEVSPGNAVLDDFNLYPQGPPSPPLTSTTDWRVFCRLNSGSWNPVTAFSSVVRAVASPGLTEGAATTQQLGAGPFVAGTVDEVDGAYAPTTLAIGDQTELEGCFQLVNADVHTGDAVAVIIVRGDFRFLEVYNRTPTLTVVPYAVTVWSGSTELPAVATVWSGSVEQPVTLVEVA